MNSSIRVDYGTDAENARRLQGAIQGKTIGHVRGMGDEGRGDLRITFTDGSFLDIWPSLESLGWEWSSIQEGA